MTTDDSRWPRRRRPIQEAMVSGLTRNIRAVWGESPTSCGAKFEDRQPVSGWIMGPPMGFDLINTSILDANLLTKALDLLLLAIAFSPLSKLRVQALGSPALGQRQ